MKAVPPPTLTAGPSTWSAISSHFTGNRQRSYSNPIKSPPISPKSGTPTPPSADVSLDTSNPLFESEGEQLSQFTNPLLIKGGQRRSSNVGGTADFNGPQQDIVEFTNPISMLKSHVPTEPKLTSTVSNPKGTSPGLLAVGKKGLISKVSSSSASGSSLSSMQIEFNELFEPVDIDQLNDSSKLAALSPKQRTDSSDNLFLPAPTPLGGLTSTSPAGSRRSSPARMGHRGSLSPIPDRRSVSPAALPPLQHRSSSSSLAEDFNTSVAQSPKSTVSLGALPSPRRDMSPLPGSKALMKIGDAVVEPKDPMPSTRVGSPIRLAALGDREKRSANNLVNLQQQRVGSPLTAPVFGTAKDASLSGSVPSDHVNPSGGGLDVWSKNPFVGLDMSGDQDMDLNLKSNPLLLRGGSGGFQSISNVAGKMDDFGLSSPRKLGQVTARIGDGNANIPQSSSKGENTMTFEKRPLADSGAEKAPVESNWRSSSTLSPLRGLRLKGSASKSVSY